MLHLSVGSEFSPLTAFHKAVKLYEHEKSLPFGQVILEHLKMHGNVGSIW